MCNKLHVLFKKILSFVNSKNNGSNVYSGRYLDGKAIYFYDESANGRIYNGDFEYVKVYNDFPNGKVKTLVKGKFLNNKKNGTWTFKCKRKGENAILKIDYADGIHEGTYSYTTFGKRDSLSFKSGTSSLKLEMVDNHPVGEISGQFGKVTFKGYCDENGLPDGKWFMDMSTTSSCKVQYEIWHNGVIIDSYTLDTSTGNKSSNSHELVDFLSSFIYRECYKIEKAIEKGSKQWNGKIVMYK